MESNRFFLIVAITSMAIYCIMFKQPKTLENGLQGIAKREVFENSSLTMEIRSKLIDNRNGSRGKLNLSTPFTHFGNYDRSQLGQSKILMEYFHGKVEGTFVEAGAHDGEFLSNTLYQEVLFNWTGLLIEANPLKFSNLLTKNRRVAAFQGCISPSGQILQLNKAKELMRPGQSLKNAGASENDAKIFCYPLLNILAAANLLKLDVLFLDVDGAEPEILETLRFQDTDIKALVVECIHSGSLVPKNCTAVKEKLETLLKPWGYELKKIIKGQDLLFMKPDLE